MTNRSPARRGKRQSQWLVLRRCLAMIRRVQQGPANRDELIKAVLKEEPEAYGIAADQTLYKRFHGDLQQIRNRLDIDLRADPRTKTYSIHHIEHPLLDLPDEDLATMAWLEQTFGPGTPHHQNIQAWLQRLRFYLSPERREQISQQRVDYVLTLGQQDDDRIDPQVELKLREALDRRLQVEFDYLSPQNEAGRPTRHVVDVFEPPYFDPALGHYYLRGWCRYNVNSGSQFEPKHYVPYRLGRISRVRFTGSRLPPAPHLSKRYGVEYQLSAQIARQGVTRRRWIDFDIVELQPDGSYLVTGSTDDVFFALQELMHYRHHCRVLGGPELLAKMQETVKKMAEIYQNSW